MEVSKQVLVANWQGHQQAQGAYVVSRRTFPGAWEYLLEDAIFTAPPNAVFSGAALLDQTGALVGIGSLFVGDAAVQGQPLAGNMFVPIDKLKPILGDLIAFGRRSGPVRPWLGLYPEGARGRVFVTRVANESPAERAGISVGDLVIAVGERPVLDMPSYFRAVWQQGKAGVTVPVTVLDTEGRMRQIEIQSMDRRDWLRINPSF